MNELWSSVFVQRESIDANAGSKVGEIVKGFKILTANSNVT